MTALASPVAAAGACRRRLKRQAHARASHLSWPAAPGVETKPCLLYDLRGVEVEFSRAEGWQKALQQSRVAAQPSPHAEAVPDALLLLQHPPVYTLGTGSDVAHLRFPFDAPPFPLHRTERGGEATYHGPGQLVLYPILDLRRHTPDLHWYMRSLEEVCIRALAAVGLHGERVPGLTGVWVGSHKLAAVGVKASRWVTLHGAALNVSPNLAHFGAIVPCGISDRPVGSVESMLRAAAARTRSDGENSDASGGDECPRPPSHDDASLVDAVASELLRAFADVFGSRFVACDGPPEAELDALVEQRARTAAAGVLSRG